MNNLVTVIVRPNRAVMGGYPPLPHRLMQRTAEVIYQHH